MKILLFIFLTSLTFYNSDKQVLSNDTIVQTAKEKYVSFTLRNNSATSIPLIIPGVMNPNLSPMSNSGVSLKIGQKILFKYKGKKRELLRVTEDLENKTLKVNILLKERKLELDK